jgi:hypothetical protein
MFWRVIGVQPRFRLMRPTCNGIVSYACNVRYMNETNLVVALAAGGDAAGALVAIEGIHDGSGDRSAWEEIC